MTRDDKEYIFENTKKRIGSLMEFTIPTYTMSNEADNDDPMGGGGQQGADPMGGGQDPMGGGSVPMGGGQDPMGGGAVPMGGGQDPMGGQQGPEGFNPQVDGGQDPMGGGADPMGDMSDADFEGGAPGEGDDVVDISELIDSQEETQNDINSVSNDIEKIDNKFSKVLKAIGAFEELLRQNDKKIEDLKSEFEKRNPTQIEKLGLQTTHSYPFGQTVDDYWKNKEATTNYSTDNDNNGKEQGQYVITKDDVNGEVNWKAIADSLNDDDFLYNQTLNGVLKI